MTYAWEALTWADLLVYGGMAVALIASIVLWPPR